MPQKRKAYLLVVALASACAAAGVAGAGPGVRGDAERLAAVGSSALDAAQAVAVQRDGKLLVVGSSTARDSGDFALARYTKRGVLDPTFGRRGLVVTDFGPSRQGDAAWAVAVQKGGRIVVAGQSGDIGREDLALARYRADGRLDRSFGAGGKVLTDLGSSSGDIAHALAIQADGKIVVAGESDAGGAIEYAVARYTAAGMVDSSFGSGGKVLTGFGGSGEGDTALAVVIQRDGKILAAGQSDVDDFNHLSMARYARDGRLDASFGNDGRVLTSLGTTYYWTVDAAIQTDGRIVATGVDDGEDFVLARYSAKGRLDSAFGKNGMVATDFAKASSDVPSALATRGGRVTVAGYTESANEDGNFEFALARYTRSGGLDASFGRRGKVVTGFGGSSADRAFGVAIDTNGRTVAVGSREAGRARDFSLARYTVDGRLDRSFGKRGRAVTDFGSLRR